MSQTRPTIADTLTKAALAALVAALPMTLIAQQTPAAKPAAAPVASAAAQPESEAKVAATGSIQVHGHWVMDVKDKDGRIVDHRDFQNSLTTAGAFSMASMLTGISTPGGFAITIRSADSQIGGSASGSNPPVTFCSPSPNVVCSNNLTQTLAGSNLILQGSVVAPVAFTVANVNTYASTCYAYPPSNTTPSPISPANCATNFQSSTSTGGGGGTFTGTTLQNPMALAAGQTLVVTVTLSFS